MQMHHNTVTVSNLNSATASLMLKLLNTSKSVLTALYCTYTRFYHSPAFFKPVPPPSDSIKTPQDLLKVIGRSCDTKLKADDWEQLWKMGGYGMRKAGINVKDRRYILWALNKYNNGCDLSEIAYDEKPKKKIRGWGPAVQFGKRIRSRRHR